MRRPLFGTIIPETMVARLEQAEDAAAEGRKICVETIEELSLIPGVAGVHIMEPGNVAAIPEMLASARRPVTMAARAGCAFCFVRKFRAHQGRSGDSPVREQTAAQRSPGLES